MTAFNTMSPKTDTTMDITTNTTNNNTFGMLKPTNENEPARLQLIDDLKLFLATAAEKWDNDNEPLKKFQLPTGEAVSCVLWNNLYFITGTDIVRSLTFRFNAFGRPISNAKKFEEGIFSDLRNLKPGIDARLEEPKSDLLDMLYKNNCIRTQKKQKVFYWYSVPHDRLFLDALERDLKREKMGCEPTTTSVAEPALSTTLDTTQELFDQLRKNMSITAAANAHALEEEVKATRISLDGQLSPRSPTTSTGSRRSTSSMNSNNSNSTLMHSTLADRAQKSRSRVNSVPTEFGQDHQQQLQQILIQQRQQQRQQYRQSHNSYFSSLSSMKSRQRIQDDHRSVSSSPSQDSLVDGVHQLDIATSNSNNGHGHFQRHGHGHTCSRHQQKHQQHLQRQQQQQTLSKNNVLPSKSLDSNTLKKTKSIFGNLPLFDGSPTYKQRRRRAASVNTNAVQQQQQSSVSSLGTGGGPERVRRHTNTNNAHSRTPSITSPTSPTSPISPVRSSFGISSTHPKLNNTTTNNSNNIDKNNNSGMMNKQVNNNNNNVTVMNPPSMHLSTSKLALAAMSAGHGNKYSSVQQQQQLDQGYSSMFHSNTSSSSSNSMQLSQKHISPSTTNSSIHSHLYMQPSSLSCSQQQDHHLMMMHQWADMIDSAATSTHYTDMDHKDHLMSTNMYSSLPSSSSTQPLHHPSLQHHHHHHQQHHHHVSSFMCQYCGKQFQSMDTLDQHRKLHENGLQQDDFMIKDETDDDNEQYQYNHPSYQQLPTSSNSSNLYQSNNHHQQQHSFSNQGTNSTPHQVFHSSSTITSPTDPFMVKDNQSHHSNEYIHSPSSDSLSSSHYQDNKTNYYHHQQHEMVGMLSPAEDMDMDIKEVISPTLQQCHQQTIFGYASPEQSDHGLTPLPTHSTTLSGDTMLSPSTHLSPTNSNHPNDFMLPYQQGNNNSNNTLLLEDELCSTSSTSSPSSILRYNSSSHQHQYYDLIQPVLLSPFKPEPYQQTLNQNNMIQQDIKDLILDSYNTPQFYYTPSTTVTNMN